MYRLVNQASCHLRKKKNLMFKKMETHRVIIKNRYLVCGVVEIRRVV